MFPIQLSQKNFHIFFFVSLYIYILKNTKNTAPWTIAHVILKAHYCSTILSINFYLDWNMRKWIFSFILNKNFCTCASTLFYQNIKFSPTRLLSVTISSQEYICYTRMFYNMIHFHEYWLHNFYSYKLDSNEKCLFRYSPLNIPRAVIFFIIH